MPNEDAEDARGGVYMVDVLVRKATLFERLFPEVHDGAALVPEEAVNPHGVSDRERRTQSLREMSASQKVAIAVALRALGYEVRSRGAEVVSVQEGSPADGELRPGDVIVAAKGERVTSPEDLRAVMQGHRAGDPVEISVRRAGSTRDLDVGTRRARNESRAVMGVIVQPRLSFPLDVRIDAGNVGGPSAGLAFALDVVDELGRDIDRGRRVAVTGTIALDGAVEEVGGIPQKTLGARLVDADVFLVPDGNAAEARRHADGLRIVPVSTFREALSALGR